MKGSGSGRISFEDQRWEEDSWDPESLLRREVNARPLTPPPPSSSRTPLLGQPLTATPPVSAGNRVGDEMKANAQTVRLCLPRHR